MLTLKCPECSSGIKVVFRHEKFEGWRVCPGCKSPSFAIVKSDGTSGVRSLHQMIFDAMAGGKTAAETLAYILRNQEAYAEDIIFTIGKKAARDLEFFQALRVLERKGNHYYVTPGLEKHVQREIEAFIQRKDWYRDLTH